MEPIKNSDILTIEHIYGTTGYALDFDISTQYIYIAEDQAGFSIYNKDTDSLVCHYYGNIENASLIFAVEEDSTLFVYDKYGSPAAIMVYDITDITEPVEMVPITGETSGIKDLYCYHKNDDAIEVIWSHEDKYVFGEYTFLWMGANIYNYPNAISGFDLDSLYIYMTGEQRGFYISELSSGNIISETDVLGQALSISVVDSIAYIAAREAGLQIFDISNVENPEFVSSYDTYGYAQSVDVKNDYLVIGSGGGGVYLFNVKDKENPQLVDRIDDDQIGYTYKAVLENDKIFVATRWGVVRIKISIE